MGVLLWQHLGVWSSEQRDTSRSASCTVIEKLDEAFRVKRDGWSELGATHLSQSLRYLLRDIIYTSCMYITVSCLVHRCPLQSPTTVPTPHLQLSDLLPRDDTTLPRWTLTCVQLSSQHSEYSEHGLETQSCPTTGPGHPVTRQQPANR